MDKLQTIFFINHIQEFILTLEGAHGEVVQREASAKSRDKVEEALAKKCPVNKEPLIVYCFYCGGLICLQCSVNDHDGHKFKFNSVAAPDTRKKLMEKLKPLRELKVSLTHAVVEVQTTKCELEIQTSFLELQKILDDHKTELLEEAARRV